MGGAQLPRHRRNYHEGHGSQRCGYLSCLNAPLVIGLYRRRCGGPGVADYQKMIRLGGARPRGRHCIVSHLIHNLATHCRDIVLRPGWSTAKLGLGLCEAARFAASSVKVRHLVVISSPYAKSGWYPEAQGGMSQVGAAMAENICRGAQFLSGF